VAAAAEEAVREPGEFVARWVAMACGIRDWATAHPHDYALIYGSPVPAETVPAAARVALVPLGLLEEGCRSGQVRGGLGARLPTVLQHDLSALKRGFGDYRYADRLPRYALPRNPCCSRGIRA